MKKRVLVTGGGGFLGSHLCEKLLEKGKEVICLDNFLTGRWQNIADMLNHPRFILKTCDVCEPFEADVDEIYNLACPASPVHYQKDPVRTVRTNVLGALEMLELAKRKGAKILQASTSEVYGDPKEHPQKESYVGHVNPIGLRSCYDEGKRCAETLFFDYHRQYGVKIKVARIFNTYGPRMDRDDGRVVSNLILQALRNEPLTIYGEGSQTRSFCYVDDLVESLILFMETDDALLGPLNLGNPDEFTILELAELILEFTGSSSKLLFSPLPSDDPKKRRPDITLAQDLLSWEPKVSLREGLKATLAYFRT
ncbi:MAG: NAD-dependent dehydratase [Chlamydiae bacterium GWA2_50_15]|nr:MAG: NAD-dependent dehydratase [Chlamydiae bacterium GWA2_50_15]OGN71127.1 MAG: NAD-dependent dehydratase [Chlamydiae bacterium RIFCSPLOWO2_02_FULL_49_12]